MLPPVLYNNSMNNIIHCLKYSQFLKYFFNLLRVLKLDRVTFEFLYRTYEILYQSHFLIDFH